MFNRTPGQSELTSKLSILQGDTLAYPMDKDGNILTVMQHIQIQAAADPYKIAMKYHDENITYQDLTNKINALINSLIERGVQKGDFVACYNHRNINYFITMLAIFKMGGVYVPLDPLDSELKIKNMLSQLSGVCVVRGNDLTPELRSKIYSVRSSIPTLIIHNFNELLANDSIQEPTRQVSVNDLAYCLFTSGSTGVPKGVLVHHLSFLNHNLAKINDLKLNKDDVVSQTTTQLFDVHIWQVITPLMIGGTVIILDRCQADAPKILLQTVAANAITVLELVPSILGIVLDELEHDMANKENSADKMKSLRMLMLTGEALPTKTSKRWFDYYKKIDTQHAVPLVNAYGPTECGDDVGHLILTKMGFSEFEAVPLCNKPIQNTTLYVLNEETQPVPMGEEGVLYIAGDCIGRGYLNDEAKTKLAFKKVNIQGKETFVYDSGDRVKISDGYIVYLGRVANSYIKLAGQRVELGSFTSAVSKHSGVSQAVSVEYKSQDQTRVITYVTLQPSFIETKKNEAVDSQAEEIAEIFNSAVTHTQQADSFNHAGWNNYNGLPFSERAVRENLNDALEQVLKFTNKNSDVLEIGCGTGMLAVSIAPECRNFTGVDISADSISIAERACSEYTNTQFFICAADELNVKLNPKKYDVVFFNAVVNYFGCPDKLASILAQAASLLKPEGKLLVLDVYNNQCKQALHSEFQYLSTGADSTVSDLKKKIDLKMQTDPDLFLHPGYFNVIQKQSAVLNSVRCCLKSGKKEDNGMPNPMVRYRYSVILDTQSEEKPLYPVSTITWGNEVNSMSSLLACLQENNLQAIVLSNVPNARTQTSLRLIASINNTNPNSSVKEITYDDSLAVRYIPPQAIDPEILKTQLNEAGYRIDNILFAADSAMLFNVTITKNTLKQAHYLPVLPSKTGVLSNRPLLDRVTRQALPELREFLKLNSDYAQYCSVIIVPELLLTSNGKTDTVSLLKQYPPLQQEAVIYFQDAETDFEKNFAAIFQKHMAEYVMPSKMITTTSLFKDLGISSLDLTKILADINRNCKLNFDFAEFRFNPCLKSLAAHAENILAKNYNLSL
jgi:amino acid adenylation domain-containing protein